MGRPTKEKPTTAEIFFSAYDEAWHGYVLVEDGQPPRHRSAKACAACRVKPRRSCACFQRCADKIRKLEEQKERGEVPAVNQIRTLGPALLYWMDNVVVDLRYGTRVKGYGWAVHKHLLPDLGSRRLDKLDDPKIFEDYWRRKAVEPGHRGRPLSPNSVAALYRCLRAAFNEMVRRRIIGHNPLDHSRPPKGVDADDIDVVTPLYVAELQRFIDVARTRRNASRWTVAMPLGLRQGEAIGMPRYSAPASTRDKPIGIDTDAGFMWVRQKAERQAWQHGCTDVAACAARYCRTGPCPSPWDHGCPDPAACRSRGCWCPQRVPGRCRIHKACPQPCRPGCQEHARRCPKRHGGGMVIGEVKSDRGRRKLSLGPQMIADVVADRERQAAERAAAGSAWREHGREWCNDDGSPIDSKSDWREMQTICRLAGIRTARVHDGRHTAATMLLLQGTDPRVVMELMGWSDRRLLDRYQHVIDEMRIEASKGIETQLYGAKSTQSPEIIQAHLDKALADVARLETQARLADTEARLAQALSEAAELRSKLESFSTDHATGSDLARVLPFVRSA